MKPFQDAWESAETTNADDGGEAGEQDAPAHLKFEIVNVAEGREMTDATPSSTDGGHWTVCSCRTDSSSPAAFFIAELGGTPSEKSPIAWGEARLWVETAADGSRLADTVGHAFDAGGSGEGSQGDTPNPPLHFNTAVLSRDTQAQPDGSLSGRGSWTATKWFYEDATEFYVDWSPAEKKGRFSEKDEAYGSDVYAAFCALIS